jgi:alpha-1,2-mannosyltransferase
VVAIDTLFYGRLTITPWNIVKYNVFPDSSRGPTLYGTEPWYFYLLNLALNFNVLLPLALISVPALGVTYVFDSKRLGGFGDKDQSGSYPTLALRLAPFYIWLGLLSAQAHKEERFMYPIYTLICFNAAVTLYLIRGWMEKAYIKATSQYQVILLHFSFYPSSTSPRPGVPDESLPQFHIFRTGVHVYHLDFSDHGTLA